MRRELWGVLLVLAAISSVQLGAAIAKGSFEEIGPTGLTFSRYLIAAVILLLLTRPTWWRWERSTLWLVAGYGASLAAMNLAFYFALERIPQGIAVSAELLGPLVLSLVLTRRLRDLAWVVLAGIAVAIVAVRSVTGAVDALGLALALLAGAFWALYILAARSVGARVRGVGGLAAAMGFGSLLLLPIGVGDAVASILASPSILWVLLLVALLSSVFTYGLEIQALRLLPTRVFGVLMAVEPAAAALFAWLVLAERLDGWEWLAIMLVMVAAAGVTWTAREKVIHTSPEQPTS